VCVDLAKRVELEVTDDLADAATTFAWYAPLVR